MSKSFAELGLNPDWIAKLGELGYERPSRLQSEVIPQALAGRDVVAAAAAGSGRTIAYALPIMQTLDPEVVGVQVIVIVPAGEDTTRVANHFQALKQAEHLHIMPLSENQPIAREVERLERNPAVIVGTPERIREHISRESLLMDKVQFVVLDGAEYLIADDLESVEEILDQTPAGRQTAVFAVRVDERIQELAYQHLFEPVTIQRESGPQISPDSLPIIKHRYQAVTTGTKLETLLRMLDSEKLDRALVFVNLRTAVAETMGMLEAHGYHAAGLHGQSDSETAERLLRNWREGSIDFLVLTDAAAAGLALETANVISYDVPADAETYALRSRLVTESGAKFTLVTLRERPLLSEIEDFLGFRIKAVLPPTRADVVAQRSEAFKQRLREIISRSNLEIYMPILNDLAAEGHDWSEIAAATVSLMQHVQVETLFERRGDRDRERPSTPRSPRNDTASAAPRSGARPRERAGVQEDREVEQGYVRLAMDAGYDIGVRPKDIVGAIANEANIPGRAVGNIDIRDRFTFVEVKEEYVDRVLTRVPSTRLRGRVVNFRRS